MKNAMILSGIAAAAATAVIFGLAPSSAPATTPFVAPAAAATTFTVDPVHSSIVYRIEHNGVAPFYGRFNKVEGTFAIDAENAGAGQIDLTVDAASVDTGNQRRDNHLRSGDFFNAEQFPAITFKSTKIEPGEGGALKVTGDLTMHGVTKSITAEVHPAQRTNDRGTVGGLATEFVIKRSEFDMTYGLEGGGLGDEVTLLIGIEGNAG